MPTLPLTNNAFERFTIDPANPQYIFDFATSLGLHTAIEVTPAFDAAGIRDDLSLRVFEDGEPIGNTVNIAQFGGLRDTAFPLPILGGFSVSGFNVISTEEGLFLGDVELRIDSPSGNTGDFEIRIIDTDDVSTRTQDAAYLNVATAGEPAQAGTTASRVDFGYTGRSASDVDVFVFGVDGGDTYDFSVASDGTARLDVALFDQDFRPVVSRSVDASDTFRYAPDGGELAYVRVTSFAAAEYTIDVASSSDRAIGGGATASEARSIALLYEAALDRNGAIDREGLNFWIDAYDAGLSIQQISREFLDSDEFLTGFGSTDILSDRALVEILYRNVLDREGEEAGVTYWTDVAADPGFSDAQLLLSFAQSPENQAGSSFVNTLYEPTADLWDFAA